MSVDTQEKRMNAVGVGRPWMRSKLPGSNDEAWRIASGLGYGGNALTPVSVGSQIYASEYEFIPDVLDATLTTLAGTEVSEVKVRKGSLKRSDYGSGLVSPKDLALNVWNSTLGGQSLEVDATLTVESIDYQIVSVSERGDRAQSRVICRTNSTITVDASGIYASSYIFIDGIETGTYTALDSSTVSGVKLKRGSKTLADLSGGTIAVSQADVSFVVWNSTMGSQVLEMHGKLTVDAVDYLIVGIQPLRADHAQTRVCCRKAK